MPLIEANGVKLHIQQMGTSGSLVAMVHGMLLGTMSTWFFAVAPALAESHRVLMYDLRGHGRSDRTPTGFTLEQMTADLDAVLATTGHEPVMLVGHSYGGSLALRYASQHPDLVRRLVLVESPVPVLARSLESLVWVKMHQREAAENRGEDLLQRLDEEQQRQLFSEMAPSIAEALKKNGKRPNLLLQQIMDLVAHTSLLDDVLNEPHFQAEELERVQCPVLLCYGENSPMLPAEDHMLRTALRDVRLQVLKGGHSLPQETTAELTEVLREFLAD